MLLAVFLRAQGGQGRAELLVALAMRPLHLLRTQHAEVQQLDSLVSVSRLHSTTIPALSRHPRGDCRCAVRCAVSPVHAGHVHLQEVPGLV